MSMDNTSPWSTLMTLCKDAKTAVIVAPYMKTGALERVIAAIPDGASVTCVSRWTPNDIQSGVTDLACRELILARNGKFLLHDRLHAKYYRFDNQVLIGSSNLTRPGMNIDGSGNLEILCPSPPEFDAMVFESLLLQEAYQVSDADFALWSRIPQIPQRDQTISQHHDPGSPVGWKPTTRRPEYLWLAYQRRGDEIPLVEQGEIANQEIKSLGIPNGLAEQQFNDWIRLSLMTSPFVKSVRANLDETIETAWDRLSQQWSISKAEAERSKSTAESWIAYFDVNISQDESEDTKVNPSH